MKVVYKNCCGVDVHKRFLVATIIKTTDGVQPSYQKKRFSTFNSDILRFKRWLLDNHCLDVCMESTGKYWVPVFNLLEDQIHVTVANPKWVKAAKGNKDDTKDSKWIVRTHCVTKREKASDYCHRTDDFHCCLPDTLYRRTMESLRFISLGTATGDAGPPKSESHQASL